MLSKIMLPRSVTIVIMTELKRKFRYNGIQARNQHLWDINLYWSKVVCHEVSVKTSSRSQSRSSHRCQSSINVSQSVMFEDHFRITDHNEKWISLKRTKFYKQTWKSSSVLTKPIYLETAGYIIPYIKLFFYRKNDTPLPDPTFYSTMWWGNWKT